MKNDRYIKPLVGIFITLFIVIGLFPFIFALISLVLAIAGVLK
jgi:hypothetical protein